MNRTFAVLLTAALSAASAATPAATAQTFTAHPPTAQAPATPPATAQAGATVIISDVQFEGFSVFDSRQIAEALGGQVGIKAGSRVTPAALEEGRVRIAQTYAESGFPFSPEVKLKTAPDAKGNTVVTYSVDESAPLSRVNVTGVTLIQPAQLQAIFKPLTDSRRLTAPGYNAALAQISRAYTAAGYIFRPQDVEASLKGGVLSFAVTEAFVATLDTSSLNLSRPVTLSTRTGQGMSATTLNDDARTLSNATGKPVVWQAEVGTRP
ncbi:POTRA domain-containing protein, partial [Deinococcus sp.]|uniref:POTRA domain-containing protein n=1 Tax=Deinococcus sp. TaxID=47478 RepID=UPI0025BAD9E9